VAIHWRQAPERAEECVAAWREIVASPEFEILLGHAVAEARRVAPTRARRCARSRRIRRSRGRRPVFVGDDRTDEDGFFAAQELGGHGV
jgi:trehalose 6-phosphate phosphatase